MDTDRFRKIADRILIPLLPGSALEEQTIKSTSREQTSALLNNNRLAVKLRSADTERLVVNRSQYFDATDTDIARSFCNELRVIADSCDKAYFRTLLRDLPSSIIARAVGGYARRKLAALVIRLLERWTSVTYEGKRIAAGVGIDPQIEDTDSPTLKEISGEDFLPVLSNGVDTMILCDRGGRVTGLLSLDEGRTSFAPCRLGRIAKWASGARLAFTVNRQGEICVFKNRKLLFARRSGTWMHFPSKAAMQRMQVGTKKLRLAVYETCLDASFARTGACIGIVAARSRADALRIVDTSDRIAGSNSVKARLLRKVAGAPFQEIDRLLRLELTAIDGATLLDHRGHLLTSGAILRIARRAAGGGRTAAAQALAEFGIGIKVSEDGRITGYKREPSAADVETRFILG